MNRTWVTIFTIILGFAIGWLLGSNRANKPVSNKPADVNQSTYSVTIDYSQSLDQMIEAGRYNYINSNINERNFPSQGSGLAGLSIEMIHFDRNISSDEAIKELDKLGLRPATLPELLALGSQYPDLQWQFPIVALGSVWQYPDGNRGVPSLWGAAVGRRLLLGSFDGAWIAFCRFAAVRKSR